MKYLGEKTMLHPRTGQLGPSDLFELSSAMPAGGATIINGVDEPAAKRAGGARRRA